VDINTVVRIAFIIFKIFIVKDSKRFSAFAMIWKSDRLVIWKSDMLALAMMEDAIEKHSASIFLAK